MGNAVSNFDGETRTPSTFSTEQVRMSNETPQTRLASIDALRGFDMFWIMGADILFTRLLSKSDSNVAKQLKEQLEHADWEGFRFYDLIFPLFLFLVGCVLPFSLEKYRSNPSDVYTRLLRRTATLLLLGILYNGLLKFQFEDLRLLGVLQRIGICYGIIAILYLHTQWKQQAIILVGILLGYWAMLVWIPNPVSELGVFSKEGNLSGYLDRAYLPGKILEKYYGFGDNEGMLSTIGALATTLLGVLAGHWLRTNYSSGKKAIALAMAGIASIAIGTVWGFSFPIIKNIWTSSFVLVAGGWSLILLSIFYFFIDHLQWKAWAFFFTVIGVNAITIYCAPAIINFQHTSDFFLTGAARLAGDWKGVVGAAGVLTCKWIFLWCLYRNRWFLRV